MRLKGYAPDGAPALSYVDSPNGTIVGSVKLPVGHLISIPGQVGPTGPANQLSVGTVVSGETADADITGEAPEQVLNLVLPKGDRGEQGIQGVQGEQGIQGEKGDAGVSLDIEGSVATYDDLAALSPQFGQAWIVQADGLLYFYDNGFPAQGEGVPFRGPQGIQGIQGVQGIQGEQGIQGPPGTTDFNELDNVPATFPPSAHTHPVGEVTGLQTELDGKVAKTSTPSRIYGTDSGGAQGAFAYVAGGTTPYTFPLRDVNGTFQVGAPTHSNHPATKSYVDSVAGASVTAATATVATQETTSSSAYTDLATTTDQVTVTVGASGVVQVVITAWIKGSTVDGDIYASFTASGANVLAADDLRSLNISTPSGGGHQSSAVFVLTGMSPGSTTFKMKYKAATGTGTFHSRTISAIAF